MGIKGRENPQATKLRSQLPQELAILMVKQVDLLQAAYGNYNHVLFTILGGDGGGGGGSPPEEPEPAPSVARPVPVQDTREALAAR